MNLKKTLSSLVSVLALVSMVACGAPQNTINTLSSEDNKSFHILSKEIENDKEIEKEAKRLNPEANSTDKDVIRELSKHKLNFNYKDKTLLVARNDTFSTKATSVVSTLSVDNRKWCSPIANQGQLGSCTAFSAVKGVREYLMNKASGTYTPLSALMFYYEERKEDGTVAYDAGSSITRSATVLKNIGVAKESTWPYNISKFTVAPPAAAYAESGQFKVSAVKRLTTLANIKTEVKKGNPVMFGIRVYESFMKHYDGIIPVPNTVTEKLLGSHAVSCFGFDDAKQVLIMRNSWGTGWGMKGYFTLPYNYFTGNLVMDVWGTTN